ncbi:hypothetical protein COMNV_01774 [Commensalibacter sp. Nvir]|uniref:SemiSWEET family transporter n=1 Tax=Commensalibacter sp. Nvir TaxID=3069817 RepID=UPI002D4F3F22|nr:hypothetical protein COMNV_01774 [Commensalibacter sp. Nvir]
MRDDSNLPTSTKIIGWIGTFTACCMFFFYIPQIYDNFHGYVTNPLQPAAATVNCIFWVCYGFKLKDKPIMIANLPGVFFGFIAFITAL